MKLLGSSGSLYDQCDRIFKYKVSQMFPKVVQKVATAVFTKKWILLLKSKKSPWVVQFGHFLKIICHDEL